MIMLCARYPKMRVQWPSYSRKLSTEERVQGNGAGQAYSVCSPLVLWKETKVSTAHFINFDLQCWAQCGKDPRRNHWETLFQEPSERVQSRHDVGWWTATARGTWILTSMLWKLNYRWGNVSCLYPPMSASSLASPAHSSERFPESQKLQRCF